MSGVIEELNERVRRETTLKNMVDMAKKLLVESELSIEKIANVCNLPLEKVQELAAEKFGSNLE